MEFAEALILTNALGGLSSLGHASGRPTDGGGIRSQLGYFHLELTGDEDQIRISLFDEAQQPIDGNGSSRLSLEAFLPGRLLLKSRQGPLTVPLTLSGTQLVADVGPLDESLMVSIELTIDEQVQRTPFLALLRAMDEN